MLVTEVCVHVRRRLIVAGALLGAWCALVSPASEGGLPPGDGSTSKTNLDLMTGRDAVVTLDTGEVFRGRMLGHGGGMLALRNRYAGEFEVPLERVRRVAPWTPPEESTALVNPLSSATIESEAPVGGGASTLPPESQGKPKPPAPGGSDPAQATAAAKPPAPERQGFWDKHEYSVEGGLSGSSGQSERSNLRFGFAGRWTRPDDVLTFDSRYIYTRQRDETVQDRFEAKLRNEWKTPEDPWIVFGESSAELDRFTNYDALLRAGAGVGYRFIRNDRTNLVGRVGGGLIHEFGSDDEGVHPEAILGIDFNHKFDDAQSFVVNAEAFPSLENLDRYRTRTKAYYEVRLSEKTNLNLRLGIEHRYDSGSGEGNRENLDYAATFVIKF